MCTLIVLHRCLSDRPLVVAANRDEFLDRPAEGLALRATRTGRIVAPLDLEAGGTWVGLSARGVFAGLTNLRPGPTALQESGAKGLRSRGEVVMAALEAKTAADAMDTLSQLDEEAYNPFQLLVADGRHAWLVVYRNRPMAVELEPGAHIVGNVEEPRIAEVLGSRGLQESETRRGPSDPVLIPGFEGVEGLDALADSEEPRAVKLTRIRERVEKLMTESGRDLFEGLAGICREHVEVALSERAPSRGAAEGRDTPPAASAFESTCVHVADRYGTRSSLLLELSADPDASRMWTTDGPPCERSFENRSSLLRELGVRLSV